VAGRQQEEPDVEDVVAVFGDVERERQIIDCSGLNGEGQGRTIDLLLVRQRRTNPTPDRLAGVLSCFHFAYYKRSTFCVYPYLYRVVLPLAESTFVSSSPLQERRSTFTKIAEARFAPVKSVSSRSQSMNTVSVRLLSFSFAPFNLQNSKNGAGKVTSRQVYEGHGPVRQH
jgi:hypothetical protein